MHTGPYLEREVAQHISEMRKERAAIGFMLQSRSQSGNRLSLSIRKIVRRFAGLRRWNRPIPAVEPQATGELERLVTPC